MNMGRRIPYLLLSLLCLLSPLASGQELPVEDFFRNPEFTQMKLSPDGQWVAALTSVYNRRNIAVLNIEESEAVPITAAKRTDISDFFWANDERIVYTIDVDGNEAFGLYAINRDGSDWRELVRPAPGIQVFPRQVLALDRLKDDPEHILVTDNQRRKLYPDVFKLNIYNGRMARAVHNPGFVTQWLTDHTGAVRAGIGSTDDPRDLIAQIVYRDSVDGEWRVLTEYHQFDDHGWTPVAFAADNRTLYVRSNMGRDTSALYTYDPEAQELGEMIFGHDVVDITGVGLSPYDHRLLTVAYEYERPVIEAIDPEWRALREAIDTALPETMNTVVSISDDERRLLLLSFSDRDPGNFYFMDRETNQLRYYASRMSWLDPEGMAEMQPVTFTARDGVELHGYLTVPDGSDGRNLPLIMHPHGGPYGIRDSWGFNRDVQFLANRGYAVLQVNFRGSGGYGKELLDIAWQKWGLEMQDDLTDAVNWAIDEGIADPNRVCIYGASYGGYATMAGITTTPELYQCAVNYVGVVDLLDLYDYWSGALNADALQAWFHRAIGHPREDRERLEATSPINHLENIQVPLLVVHGTRDPRVPIKQADMLRRQLRRRQIDHQVLIKTDEGHGFRKEENSFELYTLMDEFLKEHL